MAKSKTGRPSDQAPAPTARHPYGPRSLAALLPGITQPVFARQPAATARILADWELIVGAKVGARTQPKRLVGGTLTVACAGPVALELQHSADMLIARVNRHVGQILVQRLRLVQQQVQAPIPPAPAPSRMVDRVDIALSLAGLDDGPVRDALAGLAAAMQGDRKA